MWCNPYFAVQVSNWLDELLSTGKVELGNEKSNKELENIWKGKLQISENKIDKLETQLLTAKGKYPKFEEGFIYYICHDPDWNINKYKPGKSVNFNATLEVYRRLSGRIHIDFLLYLGSNAELKLLEDAMKNKFAEYRKPRRNEVLICELKKLTDAVIDICKLLNIRYTTPEDKIQEYNKFSHYLDDEGTNIWIEDEDIED
jgi:hypothetical protein